MPAVPAFRMLSFCTSPSVLRALTGCHCPAGEAHSIPRKVHKTLRHSVVTSLLSPSKMSQQKLSQTSCSGEPNLPAELHCCCNELQQSWSTYNKDHKDTGSREQLLQLELEREQGQDWRGGDPAVYVHDMNCADKP